MLETLNEFYAVRSPKDILLATLLIGFSLFASVFICMNALAVTGHSNYIWPPLLLGLSLAAASIVSFKAGARFDRRAGIIAIALSVSILAAMGAMI